MSKSPLNPIVRSNEYEWRALQDVLHADGRALARCARSQLNREVTSQMKAPPKSKFLQLFERDQGRCVYCGLDLKADFDRFVMATEDHLVPQSKGGQGRDLENLIVSCTVCNRLKADFVPQPPIDSKSERRE